MFKTVIQLHLGEENHFISCSPDVMGGAPVFAGTRVPVQTALDYLEAGESIDDFLEGFPTVTREQVQKLYTSLKGSYTVTPKPRK